VPTRAALFCGVLRYGYGTLAELGYKYVGQDQLIGGTWPDNEPAVSCMDWQTGQVNAKYWITNLLATTVGTSQEKAIVNATVKTNVPVPTEPVGTTGKGTCGVTAVGGTCTEATSGAYDAKKEGITSLAECVAKVKGCSNGNYVSYSAKHEDCSWYSHCAMDNLLKGTFEAFKHTRTHTHTRGHASPPAFRMYACVGSWCAGIAFESGDYVHLCVYICVLCVRLCVVVWWRKGG